MSEGKNLIITASEANQRTTKNRERMKEETLESIKAMKRTDPAQFATLMIIFDAIGVATDRKSFSTDFHLDTLLGKDKWNSNHKNSLREILTAIGYKVEFSLSANKCNERMFVSWKGTTHDNDE
jgi:hypothetical protein